MEELLDRYLQNKVELDGAKAHLDELKQTQDLIKTSLMEEMVKADQNSVRYDNATITRAVRKTLKVVDSEKIVSYLKKNKLDDYYSELPNELFPTLLKKWQEEDKIIDGTDMSETEYLSVRVKDNE